MSGILLYGGTFNPIHRGHVAICEKAAAVFAPQRVILMPAAAPPHKETPDLAQGEDRRAMCALATEHLPYAEVSDYELTRGGKSYTIDTLRHLHEQYPGEKLWLLVGTDMFLTFDQWRDWQEIGKLATVIAASREDDDLAALREKQAVLQAAGVQSELLQNDVLVMSSTAIRAELAAEGYSEALPLPVLGYIWTHGLYSAKMQLEHLRRLIRPLMSESRWRHSLNVETSAVALAKRWGADEYKAAAAGILHDICKNADPAFALHLIRNSDIITDIDFAAQPQLLHSYAGSVYIQKLGICDPDIINAVRYHTTGRAGMSLLEQIVYLADLISAERDYPDVEEMRRRTYLSPESGMEYALRYMVEKKLPEKGQQVCRETLEAYEQYCRNKKGVPMESKELALKAAAILSEKKAQDITAVEIKGLTTLGDYFVIASATNMTHVKALSDELEQKLKQDFGLLPRRIEGYQSATWILMDYGDVIIHVFYKDTREFYGVERLWADAPKLDLSGVVTE